MKKYLIDAFSYQIRKIWVSFKRANKRNFVICTNIIFMAFLDLFMPILSIFSTILYFGAFYIITNNEYKPGGFVKWIVAAHMFIQVFVGIYDDASIPIWYPIVTISSIIGMYTVFYIWKREFILAGVQFKLSCLTARIKQLFEVLNICALKCSYTNITNKTKAFTRMFEEVFVTNKPG